MDENNPNNQEPLEKKKVDQLENELKNIENKRTQEKPPQAVEPVQQSDTPQPISPILPADLKPQGLGKSKGILWIGIALLILALVGVGAYFVGSQKGKVTLAPSPAETLTPKPFIEWKTYESKKFGFRLKYPPELSLEPKEIDMLEAYREYIEYCEREEVECGGARWPEYRVAFFKHNDEITFSVSLYVIPISKSLGGIENEGYTYSFTTAGLVGQEINYKPMEASVLERIEETLEFINPEKPLKCLWTDLYNIRDIQEIPEMYRPIYKKLSGYLYDSSKNSCRATTIYSISPDGEMSPEDAANIPFQTDSDCVATCVSN